MLNDAPEMRSPRNNAHVPDAARRALSAAIAVALCTGCTLIHRQDILATPTGAERPAPLRGEGLIYRVQAETTEDSISASVYTAPEHCTTCTQLEMERVQVSTYEKGAETGLVHGLCWGVAGLTALPVLFIRDGEDAAAVAPVFLLSLGVAAWPIAELVALKNEERIALEPSWVEGPCEPTECPESSLGRASVILTPLGSVPPSQGSGPPPACDRWPERCLETDHTGSFVFQVGGLALDEASVLGGQLEAWLRVGGAWHRGGTIDILSSQTYGEVLAASRQAIGAASPGTCNEVMERYGAVASLEEAVSQRCDGTPGATQFVARRVADEIETTRDVAKIISSYTGFIDLHGQNALPEATAAYARTVKELSSLGGKLKDQLPAEDLAVYEEARVRIAEVMLRNEENRRQGGLTRWEPADEDLATMERMTPIIEGAITAIGRGSVDTAFEHLSALDDEHRLRLIKMLPEMPCGGVLATRVAAAGGSDVPEEP